MRERLKSGEGEAMQRKAVAQYKKSSVSTSSRGRTLLMLYDGCIRFLDQAIVAIEKGDGATRGNRINRAHAIISELRSTLNHDVAPELCENLEGLYSFMLAQLTDANRLNDVDRLDVVIELMDGLRQSWRQAVAETEGIGVKKRVEPAKTGAPQKRKKLVLTG
jgi:flagellar secretion chaperone FliS